MLLQNWATAHPDPYFHRRINRQDAKHAKGFYATPSPPHPLTPSPPHPPSLTALLQLVRAHSAAGAALTVWVGARVAGAAWGWGWLAPMAVAFLLSAAGNAFNDAHDVAIDRINRPQRPVPRGALTVGQARRVAYGCAALALLLALPFGTSSTLGTLAGIALLFLYTTQLKAIPLLGNAVVGLLTGMAMGYGGLLAGDVPSVLLPAATLGLLFGGRELLKTIHDLPGDRAQALRTLAVVAGPRATLLAATLCFALALALLAGWALARPTGWPVLPLTALATLLVLVPLWARPDEPRVVAWALRWSKGIGLVALVGFSVL